jgi:hypothetical protein
MTREDFIVRAVEQMARAVARAMARLMHLKDAGRLDEAVEETRREIGQLLGRDAEIVDVFSAEELLGILRPIMAGDPARVGGLAVLLAARGDLYDRRDGEGAGDESRAKALALLLEIRATRGAFSLPEEGPAFDGLLDAVDPADLPAASQEGLLAYYEAAGRYDAAEDVVFALCVDEEHGPRAAELGRALLARLLARSDEDLARGGLPREEAEQALRDLGG